MHRTLWTLHRSALVGSLACLLLGCAHGAPRWKPAQSPSLDRDAQATLCTVSPQTSPFDASSRATRVLQLSLRGDLSASRDRSGLPEALKLLERDPDESDLEVPLQLVRASCPVTSHTQARDLGTRLGADVVLWSSPPLPADQGGAFANGMPVVHLTLLEREPQLRDESSTRLAWGMATELDVPGLGQGRPVWLAETLVALHQYRLERHRIAARRLETAIREAQIAGLTDGIYSLHALLGFTSFLAENPLAAQAALRLCEEQARADRQGSWEARCMLAQADVLSARGLLVDARKRYEQTEARYQALEDPVGVADCQLGMAELASELSDLVDARSRYLEAEKAFRAAGDAHRLAGAIKGLGDVALWSCDYLDAERRFQELREIYQKLGLPLGEGQAYGRLGDVQLWTSNGDLAQRQYEQALELFRKVGAEDYQADSLMNLAGVKRLRSEHVQARTQYEQALELYKRAGNQLGQANALRSLGDVLGLGVSYPEARDAYEQALTLYRAAGSGQGEAAALRGLAWLERSFGVGYAQRQYEAALFLSHKVGDRVGEAHSRLGLGQLAVSRGDLLEARENYNRGRLLYREAGYPLGEARALQGMAEVAWGQADPSRAKVYLEEALKLFRQASFRQGELLCLINYAQAAMRANDLAAARGALEGAKTLAESLGDRQASADILFLSARALVREGRARDALSIFIKARDQYKELGVVRSQAVATADLGTAQLTLGEKEAGQKSLEEASALFEQIGMNGEADSCRSLLVSPPSMAEQPRETR